MVDQVVPLPVLTVQIDRDRLERIRLESQPVETRPAFRNRPMLGHLVDQVHRLPRLQGLIDLLPAAVYLPIQPDEQVKVHIP